jgi:hypothetical protein
MSIQSSNAIWGNRRIKDTWNSAVTERSVVAGSSGEILVIDNLIFSSNAAGSITVLSNNTAVTAPIYISANGGVALEDWGIRLASGEALKVTTTGTGDQGITAVYHFEKA